jgi:DnaJ-class molecular chaperone
MMVRQLGPGMLQQMQVQCEDCEGTGEIIAKADKCKTCKGEKTIKDKKTLTVNIQKGMMQGSKIVFRQESDQAVCVCVCVCVCV